ncbi:MAG: hypothetical protein AB8H47_07915 [Bacteroidia bacterium]
MKILSFLFCWIICISLYGQDQLSDQDSLRQKLGKELLLNGKEYRHYYPRTKGKQYIAEKVILVGNLWYEGVYYEDLQLNFDIYNNLLFVAFVSKNEKLYLILNQAKIQAFEIIGMRFINLPDSSYQGLAGGIYEEAFRQGERHLFIKHKKSLTKEVDTLAGTLQKFERKTSYYLVEKGVVYKIRRKKDLIHALGENSDFEQQLKENKLKLRKNRSDFEHNLLQALRYGISQN